jgi:hypothetical protein
MKIEIGNVDPGPKPCEKIDERDYHKLTDFEE